MSIQLTVPPKRELKPCITVIGVGGAGGNAVNNMITAGLEGVDFVVANTDAQALANSKADRRIQIGAQLTEGLGAGSDPEVGRAAAEEAMAEIVDQIQGAHMAFVTAGMGGGTGTGAAAVIARACREQGILTIGVVTKPFEFEGPRRMRSADTGINALSKEVDTLIIIPNQNLFRVANEQTGFVEAFAIADEVLHSGVASVTDLMTKPGLINLDFADVRMVMNEMGKAMMGTGEAEGPNRALEAAEAAIANPLLEDDSMQGASGVLINITGGQDMTLYEVDEAANRIKREVATDANIIIGAIYDDALAGVIRVSVVATGIDADESVQRGPRVVPMERPEAAASPIPHEASMTSDDVLVKDDDVEILEIDEPSEPVAEQMDEEVQEKASVPSFLVPKPEEPSVTRHRKRSRGFLERVLGGRKNDEETSVLLNPKEEALPVETQQIPTPVQETDLADTGIAENGDVSESSDATDINNLFDSVVTHEGPSERMQEPTDNQVDIEVDDPVVPPEEAIPTPRETDQSGLQVTAEPTYAPEPPMVQTSMQPNMISGYEDAQLDIPAFLRRQD
ncbi:MAG: cell division protein FtsZ [PS1 clade bacterium]|uniref:Cell division protein FtsZ n=1 Tax=PS1 clade bacterium TaxID=2175152 RepID=A0A368E336_9PROT|nr:MAG: cell division protein FtsZ [PS1 clade bacterium]